MFKRIARAFGKKKRRPRTPESKLAPGEGIRQLAAALPETGDAPPARTPAPPPAPTPARTPPEPTRDELISEAMRIRSEKAEILNELPARDRAKLRKLAEKMLLSGVSDDDSEGEATKGAPPRKRH
ncbi:MAG: hypothetical protein ISR44_00270 [Rhodospirillales bacterium]|nr:hypothetical protein [Rhodospirillales bacterium]